MAFELSNASQRAEVQAALGIAHLSAANFHNEAVNGANIKPALELAIAAVKAGGPRAIVVPYRVGGWTVPSQVVFDLSDFTLVLLGDIVPTGLTRQKTLLFAYNTNIQPELLPVRLTRG